MMAGLYVFIEYVKASPDLFQQNKINVSFRETVRLITRNHSSISVGSFKLMHITRGMSFKYF